MRGASRRASFGGDEEEEGYGGGGPFGDVDVEVGMWKFFLALWKVRPSPRR